MTDEQLANNIPHHWDLLALLNYIKSPTKSSTRKQTTLECLRKKYNPSKTGVKSESDDENDSDRKILIFNPEREN